MNNTNSKEKERFLVFISCPKCGFPLKKEQDHQDSFKCVNPKCGHLFKKEELHI